MPKRRTHDSDARYAADDNPIGLTSAFAPVKGPQSVDYDTNDDPVGLTQAFGAIPDQDEPRAWDEAGKWKDFDWDASFAGQVDNDFYGSDEDAARADSGDSDDDGFDSYFDSDSAAVMDAEPQDESGRLSSVQPAPGEAAKKTGPRHGRHVAPEKELSPRMKKSQRTRRVLTVLVILLVLALAALGYFMFRTFSNSQQEAAQQTQEQASTQERDDIASNAADDATEATGKLADVPNLASVLNVSQDDAIAALGRGAIVTANNPTNEEGNPIVTTLNVALTEEPADSKTGTPTVYLGLGEDGLVRQAGYSASASALGFGSLSFADAVNSEHVVEKTLAKIGVNVAEGSAALPANKDEYSTYGSDGTTVVRERCSFEGATDVNGIPCSWSAVLSYDYTTQVVTGNLNDTVRIIYVYITEN